ncbi:MAG: PAS domain S-box protein [Acidobacteriaceae bacterium]
MKPGTLLKRDLLRYGSPAVLAPLAVWCTWFFPAFSHIPWTLSYLVITFVGELGGTAPALIATAICAAGVHLLVIAPTQSTLFSLVQTAAFLTIGLFICYLIRQRDRAISSLRESDLHHRSVTETASDVIVTIDENSQILRINPSVEATFGYKPEELVGKSLVLLMPVRFRDSHLSGISRYLSSGQQHIPWTGVELPGQCKDGREIPLEISFARYDIGARRRFTGFIRDISERKRTHTALMQSEKLAAVGRLASSIAHEINNPLESVTNLIYISRGTTDLESIQSYLDLAEQEIRRISVIANQTLQFHKQSNSSTAIMCSDLLSGCLALFQGKITNSGISVEKRARDQRPVYCAEGEIRQVINNLIGNAVDAMPHGGRLLARTRTATDWKSQRKGVVLTVADTGTGMSSEVLARIFEPFFSTKGGGGAGLGLWISSQLIARSGGTLYVRSSQRQGRTGTVFTLFLPARVD